MWTLRVPDSVKELQMFVQLQPDVQPSATPHHPVKTQPFMFPMVPRGLRSAAL